MAAKGNWFRDWAPTILRLSVGLIFIFHGWSKVHGNMGRFVEVVTTKLGMPSFLAYVSAYTELVGGILLVLGLFTRFAALALAANMAVAVWKVHPNVLKNFGQGSNGPNEYALLLLLTNIALVISGAGNVSIDKNLLKRN